MKTKIGIPFGLALVMFIGVFTTMLALGALNPQPAEAVVATAPEISISEDAVYGYADWMITLTNDTAAIAASATIDIMFTGMDVGVDCSDTENTHAVCIEDNWKIEVLDANDMVTADVDVDSVAVTESTATVAINTGDVVTEDLSVTPNVMAKANNVPASATFRIIFTAPKDASGFPTGGIRNSATPGAQSIEVEAPMGETAVMSNVMIEDKLANLTVTNDPTDPGAQARYQIKFATGFQLNEGTDDIILNIDASVGVPTSLGQQDVRVSASAVTGMSTDAATPGSTPNQSRPLDDAPRYRVVPGTDNRKEYRITIPDMDGSPDRNSSIMEAAVVTVTLQANAGFTNATESGNDDFKVSTTRQTDGVEYEVFTPVLLFSDDLADNRNKPLTVTGKGFKNGTTATVYLDKNRNGMKDRGDVDLIAVPVASDDTFEATFNVTVPPFDPLPLRNVINAVDGEVPTNTVTWVAPEEAGDNDANLVSAARAAGVPIFEVEGLISVSPSTLGIGDTLTIDLEDWPEHIVPANARLEIGGVDHTDEIRNVSGSGSSRQLEVMIGNDVELGTQQVEITTCSEAFAGRSCGGASENDNTNVIISGADLIVRPLTAVPNQSLTVTGRGFTGNASINGDEDASEVSFGGSPIRIAGESRQDGINNNQEITLDNGGNWSASIIVPVSDASVTPGPHILKVVDDENRTGLAEVTIAERTLTLDPPIGRVGTVVTVSGTGFPARNSASGAEPVQVVQIEYPRETGTFQTVASVTPDTSGSFSTTFRIPLDAGIPSTNTVRARFDYPGVGDTFTRTSHEVPEGTITLDKTDVHPGDIVNVTGKGFKAFNTISLIEVGVAEVTPAPRPLTNATGQFTASFVVPGLEVGIKNVQVRVGSVDTGTVASGSLNILEEGDGAMMPEVMMAEAATPDVAFAAVIAEDNLIAVYHFDPATQNEAPNYGYTVYDARPLFMSGNNLDSIEPASSTPYRCLRTRWA